MSFRKFFEENIVLNVLMFIAIIAGIVIRLKGLGTWPLTIDEYYIAKAAKNILEYGVPQWEGGGYYVRGLFQQYITAALYYFGVDLEFGARIIPALMNILSIIPLYILSKKIRGGIFASIVVIIFSFSLWEIEMARFARMYAPFQAVFLLYILFLYKALIEKDEKSVKWLFVISFISIFIYEANIFLAVLNFLTILWHSQKNTIDFSNLWKGRFKLSHLIFSVIILLLVFGFREINFKEGTPSFPQQALDYYNNLKNPNKYFSEGLINKPVILLSFLLNNTTWLLIFSLTFIFTVFSFIKFKSENLRVSIKFSFAFFITLAILNLFGLLLLSLIIFLLLRWVTLQEIKLIKNKSVLYIIGLYFVFWFLFCLMTDNWQVSYAGRFGSGTTAKIKNILMALFHYPNNYYQTWRYFFVMPWFTIIAFFTGLYGYFRLLRNYEKETIWFPVFTAFLVFTMITMLSIPGSTRYSFLIFPIVLSFITFSIYSFSTNLFKKDSYRKIALSALIIIFLSFSEDFRIYHLLNVDSKEVNFRMIYNQALEEHYYPRWDVETPAAYVNNHASNDDIIIINEFNLEFYLNRFDYVYVDYKEGRFYNSTLNEGTVERWTNKKLIWNENDLYDIINTKDRRVWFISKDVNSQKLSFINELNNSLIYKNIDSSFSVYEFNNRID